MAVANRLVREVAAPLVRQVLIRPGRVRRVPLGMAEGLRFQVDPGDAGLAASWSIDRIWSSRPTDGRPSRSGCVSCPTSATP